MEKLIVCAIASSLLISCASPNGSTKTATYGPHEYAPIEKKSVAFQEFDFPSIKENHQANIKEAMKESKLVLLVYFSAWCPNWRNEMVFVKKLYEEHKSKGLEIIGISEYASIEETRALVNEAQLPFPIIIESDSRDAYQSTTHFTYRRGAGDRRKWGSPWHLFIDPSSQETWVVNGELIEAQTEAFIAQRISK